MIANRMQSKHKTSLIYSSLKFWSILANIGLKLLDSLYCQSTKATPTIENNTTILLQHTS